MRELVMSLVCIGCTSPRFVSGDLQCAASGRACPTGFYCAADQHCWRNGDGPDLAGAASDLATVGDLAASDMAGTPSRCGGLAVLLCDGFESPTFDAQWTVTQKSGAMTVDGVQAWRGSSAAHAHSTALTPPPQPSVSINEGRTFPINGTIYVRAWIYARSPIPGNTSVAVMVLADAGPGGVELDLDGGHPALYDNSRPQSGATSASLFPTDRWTCVQLTMSQGVTRGDVHLFVDGSEVTDAGLTGASITPVAAFYAGLEYFLAPALPDVDVWIDELIVDDKPTTCDE